MSVLWSPNFWERVINSIDVFFVQDETYLSSPFHVRFGKFGILRAKEKIVSEFCCDLSSDKAPNGP